MSAANGANTAYLATFLTKLTLISSFTNGSAQAKSNLSDWGTVRPWGRPFVGDAREGAGFVEFCCLMLAFCSPSYSGYDRRLDDLPSIGRHLPQLYEMHPKGQVLVCTE